MAIGGELTGFETFLNEKPTLDELCRHVRVDAEWYKFGVLLKLDTIKLEGIRIMNESSGFKTVKMFELWLSSNPTATRREIIETLKTEAIGEKTIAEEYNKALKEIYDLTSQILQKHSKSLSQLLLPMEVVQALYTEGVFSEEMFDKVEKSGGYLAEGPLRALSSTVSKDPNQLKVFASVLLKSEETVRLARDTLKDYSCVAELYLSPTYRDSFDEIRAKFGTLIDTVVPLIKSAIITLPPSNSQESLEAASLEVSSPLEKLKKYLGRCFRELKPQLSITNSFDDVMELVEEKCTVVNICCLETIINHYNIVEANRHVNTYKVEVDKLCEEIKLSVCQKENLMTGPSSLLKCETIKFVLEWETDKHTFNEIRELLWKAFGKMAKRVLVKCIDEDNSIIVTCYAPENVMNILLMEVQKNLHKLIKMGVIKLTIAFHTIWDEHRRDKEIKSLVDEVRVLEENIKELHYNNTDFMKSKDVFDQAVPEEAFQSVFVVQEKQYTDSDIVFTEQTSLSKKLEIETKMSKVKTLEIEMLTRHKEVTDKVLVDKQEEIKILQEKITSLTLQLIEREEKISQLIENMKVLQSKVVQLQDQIKSDYPQLSQKFKEILVSQQQLSSDDKLSLEETEDRVENIAKLTLSDHEAINIPNPRDTESVRWTGYGVTLTSPTVTECKEVMHQLKKRQHTTWRIEVNSLSPDSLLTVLTNINECLVRGIYILNTFFDSGCVNKLVEIVTYNKTVEVLYIFSSPLLPDTYYLLASALSSNDTIKRLWLSYDKNITDKDVCHFIATNKTLEELCLNYCPNITNFGIQQIQKLLFNNKSLSYLYINGNILR